MISINSEFPEGNLQTFTVTGIEHSDRAKSLINDFFLKFDGHLMIYPVVLITPIPNGYKVRYATDLEQLYTLLSGLRNEGLLG